MPDNLTGQLRRSERVIARQIVDQWLLIPIQGTGADLQKVYMLNETSAEIWRLLEQPMSMDQLVAALQAGYAAPEEVIRREAGEFVADLLERGFLAREVGDG